MAAAVRHALSDATKRRALKLPAAVLPQNVPTGNSRALTLSCRPSRGADRRASVVVPAAFVRGLGLSVTCDCGWLEGGMGLYRVRRSVCCCVVDILAAPSAAEWRQKRAFSAVSPETAAWHGLLNTTGASGGKCPLLWQSRWRQLCAQV